MSHRWLIMRYDSYTTQVNHYPQKRLEEHYEKEK